MCRSRFLAVVVAVVLLATACTSRAVSASLERSTAPLLVPTGDWRAEFDFTAPPGATNLYQLRWNFRPGATDVVTGWQVSSSTEYEPTRFSEGPGQELVDEALRASRGEQCTPAGSATGLQLCLYEAEFARGGVNAYLVRMLRNQILVIDYNNLGADRRVYNANTLEARFINADFEAVPINGNIDDYLVSIY